MGGVRIGGYAIRRKGDAPRPLVVHGHGYGGGDFEPRWAWAQAGLNVVGVEVRGYGRSRAALPGSPSPHGYVLTGIRSPEDHVLRGAVCDYARAVEVGKEMLGPLVSRTVLHGASFAGGLAVMAEAVWGLADLLVAAVPSLGWTEERRVLAREGSGAEIDNYLAAYPRREAALMRLFSYVDAMNFAPDVRCPALIGVGLADRVVPAPTVYAVADNLGGLREVVELPVSHTELPEERLWEGFEAYWLRLAAQGVPPGFGEREKLSYWEVSDAP